MSSGLLLPPPLLPTYTHFPWWVSARRETLLLPFFPADAETSDEEYGQDEAAANAGSDVCSDLDEDEGSGDREAEGRGNDDGFSDEDDEVYTFTRPTRKPRVLESDDEESKDGSDPSRTAGSVTVSGKSVIPPPMYEDTCSMSVFGEAPSAEGGARAGPRVVQGGMGMAAEEQGKRKLGMLAELEEASMPPLVLNESFESEESSTADSPRRRRREKDAEIEAPIEAAATEQQTRTGFCRTNGDGSSTDTGLPDCKASNTQTPQEGISSALPADSGLGMSLEDRSHTQSIPEDGSETQPVPEEEPHTEPALDGDSTGMGDNSLELSFQWGASLPPAQPQRDPSLELFGSAVSRRDRSQEKEVCRYHGV